MIIKFSYSRSQIHTIKDAHFDHGAMGCGQKKKILLVSVVVTDKPAEKRPLGRKIFEWTLKRSIKAGNCVDSAQDRNYWRVLVNEALNLRVP